MSLPYAAHTECGGAIATPGATTGVPSALQAEPHDAPPPRYCPHGGCWCSCDAGGRGRVAPVGRRRGSSHHVCRGISEFVQLQKEPPNAVPDGLDEFLRHLDASAARSRRGNRPPGAPWPRVTGPSLCRVDVPPFGNELWWKMGEICATERATMVDLGTDTPGEISSGAGWTWWSQ